MSEVADMARARRPFLKKYHGTQNQRWLFGAWTLLVFGFLYIPILLLLFSFNSSRLNISARERPR